MTQTFQEGGLRHPSSNAIARAEALRWRAEGLRAQRNLRRCSALGDAAALRLARAWLDLCHRRRARWSGACVPLLASPAKASSDTIHRHEQRGENGVTLVPLTRPQA